MTIQDNDGMKKYIKRAVRKSSVKWDVEEDENFKFVHCSLKHKCRVQKFQGLIVDGVWLDDPSIDKDKFFDFFKNKFKKVDSGAAFVHVKPQVILSDEDASFIERDIDDTEIKNAVWEDIKGFFALSSMPHGANSAFFSLIPKVQNLVLIMDFRPISLVGCFYKIITKIVTNQLASVIDKIISPA
ncbi:uncharacterized protein [Rutidosis leptorrhynchoides]|uniref:uncharacterized protein n=1 Tax=Rutidosis leptorrhynchoides TaxID=125765 RepID=UPI003A99A5C4